MKAVDFQQRTHMLAENQPEYETMPVFTETRIAGSGEVVAWSMTACFELSDREIEELAKTKKLWYTQMLFGNNFQPVRMSTENPFQ